MSSFSQDFIDTKLKAIRATQNRTPQKPVDKAKEKRERKAQKEKEKSQQSRIKAKKNQDHESPKIAYKPEPKQEKVFKIIPFDPTGKIQVKVNDKTWVYVDPDNYDLEALKEKYRPKPMSRTEKF